MKKIEVFDPAMCCSSGVCGPDVDPELVRFAADLAWLKEQGVAPLATDDSCLRARQAEEIPLISQVKSMHAQVFLEEWRLPGQD